MYYYNIEAGCRKGEKERDIFILRTCVVGEKKMFLPFPCALHPVNRFAHKHAMADMISKNHRTRQTRPSP